MPFKCPLCCSESVFKKYHQEIYKRDFFQCNDCDLVFANRAHLLDIGTEKSRYDLHENNLRTQGYENFLRRLINPICKKLDRRVLGLDYGCGPYPMLIEIFNEEGFDGVDGHDPIYRPNPEVFNKKYDFITMCEVIEHMNDPLAELRRVYEILKPGALLVISTGILNSDIAFEKWHYINDDTHINLFSMKTFEWIGSEYRLELESSEKNLVIFSKK